MAIYKKMKGKAKQMAFKLDPTQYITTAAEKQARPFYRWTDGVRSEEQEQDDSGRKLWNISVNLNDGDSITTENVRFPSNQPLDEPDAFKLGQPLKFEGLAVNPYVNPANRVGLSFVATGLASGPQPPVGNK